MYERIGGGLRRVAGIGLVWAILWVAAVSLIGVIIAIVDPDSIDPGEGPMITAAIFGPMGFFSGVAFALLTSIGRHRAPDRGLSPARAAGWGMLGSAIVQVAYLGHGDLGLVANIKMALVLCVLGGIVAMVWLAVARRWPDERPSPQHPSIR
jgi:hypothetical protein